MPGKRDKDFERNHTFSIYDAYGHALAKEPLPRGVLKLTNLLTLTWSSLTYPKCSLYD